ncbi:MAG TPA: GNAT family N-acetyltransferase [Phycisphaerales bacterium]|nr:GNAT family N-acetyltransferase [Phycisphaerales bacterium]
MHAPTTSNRVHPDLVRLRPVGPGDLDALYAMQADAESNAMAGTKPRPRDVFFAVWDKHFVNPLINGQVIEVQRAPARAEPPAYEIAGSIACFQPPDGSNHVGYWIAREHWGRGFASRALPLFLKQEPRRPLHATTAASNAASQRILERCGFRRVGQKWCEETERYLAREVVEWVLES